MILLDVGAGGRCGPPRHRSPGDGCAQRGHGELGGHALVDGVADDAVAGQVFDRAAVQRALVGGVLGDVGDPHLIRSRGAEALVDVVVVDGRAGCLPVLRRPFRTVVDHRRCWWHSRQTRRSPTT